jgi:hypothetical protein
MTIGRIRYFLSEDGQFNFSQGQLSLCHVANGKGLVGLIGAVRREKTNQSTDPRAFAIALYVIYL